MRDLIRKFPVVSIPVRKIMVREYEQCPECGSALNRRWVCIACNYDAEPLSKYDAPAVMRKVPEDAQP